MIYQLGLTIMILFTFENAMGSKLLRHRNTNKPIHIIKNNEFSDNSLSGSEESLFWSRNLQSMSMIPSGKAHNQSSLYFA